MTEMKTLQLPRLVAGRDFAADMIEAFAAQEGPIEGTHVVVDATYLLSGTASFAGELVRQILQVGNASELRLVGAPPQFAQDATQAASDLHVTARFDLGTSAPLATA